MNRLTIKRFRMLIAILIIFSAATYAQFDKLNFIKSAPADAVKYLEAYLTPWANGFGAGLSGSWYNTAKPHKLGGFDITFGVNAGMVPSTDNTIDLSKIGLSSGWNPKTGTVPNIAGSKTSGTTLTYSQTVASTDVTLASFNAPPGVGLKFVPVPTAQIGLGLPLGTEIKGRFIPKINFGDRGHNVSLWGVGLIHSIMQYIPGNELIPVDASLFAGYTKLTGNLGVTLMPETLSGHAPNYSTYNVSTSFNDQFINATVTALNVSAIASLNLPVITLYGGLGYSKTSTEIKLKGNFPTPAVVTPALPAVPYAEYNDSGVKKGTDFPAINIDSFSGLRANIGFRIKFAVITIHADYTRAQYNVFSTGLGISFR